MLPIQFQIFKEPTIEMGMDKQCNCKKKKKQYRPVDRGGTKKIDAKNDAKKSYNNPFTLRNY